MSVIVPTPEQAVSRQLAVLLMYTMQAMGQTTPDWVSDAARCATGDTEQAPIMGIVRADLIVSMTPGQHRFIIGNGRNPNACALSAWWDARCADIDQQRMDALRAEDDPSDIVHIQS